MSGKKSNFDFSSHFEETSYRTDFIEYDFNCSTIDGYCKVPNKPILDPKMSPNAVATYVLVRSLESTGYPPLPEFMKSPIRGTFNPKDFSIYRNIYSDIKDQDYNSSSSFGYCKIPNEFMLGIITNPDETFIYVLVRCLESMGKECNLSELTRLSRRSKGYVNRCLSVLEKIGCVACE